MNLIRLPVLLLFAVVSTRAATPSGTVRDSEGAVISNAHSKSAFLLGGLQIQLAASYACEAEQASAKQD